MSIRDRERDYLEAGGFEVELIFDGNEGLNRAMAGGWDALILDVMLPGKSGFEVCREVRKSCLLYTSNGRHQQFLFRYDSRQYVGSVRGGDPFVYRICLCRIVESKKSGLNRADNGMTHTKKA